MIKLNLQQIKNSAHLFKGISDTALTSCLEGFMGDVYGESENPKMAIAFLGYTRVPVSLHEVTKKQPRFLSQGTGAV